jgi:hypothetical protein
MSNPAVAAAARWLAGETNPPRPIVPNMRRQFDLTPAQACDAIRLANEMRRVP